MKMLKITTILAILVATIGPEALAVPIADGRFDPSEGYTTGYYLDLNVQDAGVISDQGQLWYYQDQTSNDLYVAMLQPLTLVDNTYGTNAIGWGKHVAPSGKNHNFNDLKGSDKARFAITDGAENVVFDFTLDYISASDGAPSGYASLGVTAGDGDVHAGSTASLLAWGTSLDYNFNTLGHVLTKESPATDKDYTENPSYSGWVFEVAYEFQIDGSLFANNGFGGVTVPIIHDSPNKIGRNKVYPHVDGVIPEPATIALLGLGNLVFLLRRRRA
jgi:hypothetical protein